MKLPDTVRRIFRMGRFRSEVDRDLDEELAFHFSRSVEALTRDGMSRQEAEKVTRERFGDTKAYRTALMRIDHGEVRMRERSERLDSMARTVAAAIRGIRRNPALSIAIVAILGLGIGANAVMFGVVDRLLLSPPQHVADWQNVRHLFVERTDFTGARQPARTLTHPDFMDFRTVSGWSAVAGYTVPEPLTVGNGPEAHSVDAVLASADLFPLLGVETVRGRFFTTDEDDFGSALTAVLSHEYWERRFGAAETVLGQSIQIGKGDYTVIGVAPPGFTGAELQPVDVWLPLEAAYGTEQDGDAWSGTRNWWWLRAVARLADDATDEATTAQATAAHRAGRAEMIANETYDAEVRIVSGSIIAARGPNPTAEASVSRWLAGVSAIVLLIACFNVANLLLARGIRARREVAVRLALGVSRRRLIADLTAEGLALAGLGAGAAWLIGQAGGPLVHSLLLPNVAFTDTGLDGRLMLFTIAAAGAAGLIAAVLPALQSSRVDVGEALRTGNPRAGSQGSRARNLLLVGQSALSVVLLVGAGLFVQSLRTAEQLDLGYDAEQVVVLRMEWIDGAPAPDRHAVYEELRDRVRRLPGVRQVGLTYTVPFHSSIGLGPPRVDGRDSIPRHRSGGPYVNKVGSGYFDAMGLGILTGRAFESADDGVGAAPVTILSESMARAIWPDESAVGRCIFVGSEPETPCTLIVGVVENHRRQELVEDDHFLYFVNQAHPAFSGPAQALMVGTDATVADLVPALRAEADGISPLSRFVDARGMRDLVEPELRSWRLGASMFTLFGLLALVVAAGGLYSVLAFDVALRRHELGVRSALGAGVGTLVGLVLRHAFVLVSAGVVLGLVSAWIAGPFIAPLLFRVAPTDPVVYSMVTGALLVVAGAAGTLPAWRATRVDPREALQAD